MKNLFEHTSSPWIRYSSYEYRTAEDGTLYIVVSADAKPEMYNPMKDAESLVLDAVNIGLQVMHKAPEDELKSMVLRLSLIHISEPTRLRRISYAVFCLKKKK